ncbi:MAG: uL15 family ribosomal protein [Nanoarchaeota archaeon]
MISKIKISNRVKKKKNPEIIEIVNLAKNKNLLDLAKRLSAPRSQYKIINLDELEKIDNDNIIVVGKVLGSGNISKKIKIAALGFSEQAKEKLKKANCNIESIKTFLDKNSKLEGITLI